MSLVGRAAIFATAAHSAIGQVRKYDGSPYIHHPQRVADTVREFGGSDDMIAAAWLHDVVEDTAVEMNIITGLFGCIVGNLVEGLTDVSTPSDGNRAARKAIDRERLLSASADTQFVKLADIIDNSSDIRMHDLNFWKVYQGEMIALLDGMYSRVKLYPIYEKARRTVEM
tara:strand:- start:4 stop:513 length:510 start_codon:yes stop_codon:yes gene_type:complete